MTNAIFEKFNVPTLTKQQENDLTTLEAFIETGLKADDPHVAIIEGAAGTGKSVLLTALFRRLQTKVKNKVDGFADLDNYFTVNHPELLKVYQALTTDIPELRQKDYVRPTSLINRLDKEERHADVVVIDEGHLLLSKSEPYIRFTQDNQLHEIIKRAKVVIVVFDFDQVMQSKMLWTPDLLQEQLVGSEILQLNLNYQHRVQAPQAIQEWIEAFGHGELRVIPKEHGDYDIQVFDKASDMFSLIKERDASVGLSRIVATTGFPRRHPDEHNVYMDDFDLPWDEYDPQKTPWAERPESINEVGSIYTVQGFDLNYVGVILSPAYEYDDMNDRIVVNTDKVTHREIYKRRPDVTDPATLKALAQTYMLNTLHVLISWGIKGLYVTAADDKLRNRLLELRG
ncbi:DUF2075 domain-containing protein [Weissella ceti]|uniref:DUF2075 domain-containing protein n=1 Tax=Weissella ceti TaxID=759620 RepID=A0ABT3E2B9_9LACO|nr:DUF2075 domain-containing protein [Weissella ceti]MCW0952541.1 DUF2075 domain-containing protein [Weissella ceti]QVK11793.1 DUF2075 domain-containing protein [Weissella ceti]